MTDLNNIHSIGNSFLYQDICLTSLLCMAGRVADLSSVNSIGGGAFVPLFSTLYPPMQHTLCAFLPLCRTLYLRTLFTQFSPMCSTLYLCTLFT